MASKCFYLILHSVLFILTVLVIQILCDSGGHYEVDIVQKEDFTFTIVPLTRERRQVHSNEKKPDEPNEAKAKTTKKPTSLDVKPSAPSFSDTLLDKPRNGASKKEPQIKATNVTVVQSASPPELTDVKHTEENSDNKGSDQHEHHDLELDQKNSSLKPTSMLPGPPIITSIHTTIKPYGKASGPVLTNITVPDIFITDFNQTLKDHNITQEKLDHHLYYNSSLTVDPETSQKYWVDIDKNSDTKVNEILSKSYRRAITVKLSFDFPFYGHLIRNITIATGGFLYTGDYVHSWLAATQYIAPLMANFDTTMSKKSMVKYLDNGTSFTVQWENVILQEKSEKGGFTFQCTLFNNGDIVFVYQQVPVVIEDIKDDNHPVKIGLSDAYIIDRTIFFVRRKTIYEYHRINFQKQEIKNGTVIILNALDTCLDMKDCYSCLTQLKNFRCNWCSNRCSNGMDRHRQDWITNGCDKTKLITVEECSKDEMDRIEKMQSPLVQAMHKEEGVGIDIAGIIGILFIVCLVLGVGMWFFYAYRNPHTPAGQFLIRYRPSQWSWRRGEARYTAATIHM